jgi:hypothetical protein
LLIYLGETEKKLKKEMKESKVEGDDQEKREQGKSHVKLKINIFTF